MLADGNRLLYVPLWLISSYEEYMIFFFAADSKNKVCQNSNSGEPRKIAFRPIHKSIIPKASLQGLHSAIHSPGPVSYLNSDTLLKYVK